MTKSRRQQNIETAIRTILDNWNKWNAVAQMEANFGEDPQAWIEYVSDRLREVLEELVYDRCDHKDNPHALYKDSDGNYRNHKGEVVVRVVR